MSEPAASPPERQRRWAPRRVVVHRIGRKAFLDLLRKGAILEDDPRDQAWREKPRVDLLVVRPVPDGWREVLLRNGWRVHPRSRDALCLPVSRESAAGLDLATGLEEVGLSVCWWQSRAKWAHIE